MIDYGKTHSTEIPPAVDVKETLVFVAENVEEETIEQEDGSTITGYVFDYYAYDKNEYIKMISEKNEDLEAQLTDTQLALCEIYEELV